MEGTTEVMERRKVMAVVPFFTCVVIFSAILAYVIGKNKGREKEEWRIEEEQKEKVWKLLRAEEDRGFLSKEEEEELIQMLKEFYGEYEIEQMMGREEKLE